MVMTPRINMQRNVLPFKRLVNYKQDNMLSIYHEFTRFDNNMPPGIIVS